MSKFVLTAQLQLQAPNNVKQVVQQIQNQLQGVNVNIQVQGSPQAQKQLQQVTQQANQATSAAERMGKAFALSIRRFAAFSIATRAVGLFTSTLNDAVQTSIDFERQLIKVAQVTGKSISQLRGLTKQITNLSTGFGVASSDLLEVSTVLAQAGLSAEDTSVALKTLAKAALAPNFDSISETAEGAIAILAQFQEGVGALEKQLGSINAVAGAFAVEASDLIDVVRRTGGVFKSSGGNLNELLALFTSVRATTRESAESIGTGLRTIFTRIQRPKTIEFLKQFGVELVDLNGKFVGPYEAIKKLSEALSGLGEGDLTFISIAEELGGFRQIGKVLPLLQQFSTAQSALNVAMKAGDSLTQDAASAQAALAIRIMKVKEEFLALIRSVTETSTFQVMANTALSLASALIKIGDAIKPLLPMLAALAAFKLVKGMGGFFGGMMSGATSGRTYNKGGKVLGFARGGLVPGTGNSDTVPAMLSPGEFVIRKSSVNKMGADTLAAMNSNRYAYGGKARTFGIAALDGTQDSKSANIPISAIREKLGINTDKAGNKNLDMVIRGVLGSKGSDLNVTAKSDTVTLNDPGIKDAIYNNIKSQMYGLITSSATALSNGTGIPMRKRSINPNKVLAKVGTDSTIGSVFEGALGLLGGPFSAGKSTAAIDYPRGLGKMASAFSSLANMPVDAKKTADSKKISEMLNKKIPNFFAEFIKRSPQYASFKSQLNQGKLDKLKGREFDLTEYQRVTGNSKATLSDLSGIASLSRKSGQRQLFRLAEKFADGGEVVQQGTQKYLASDVVKAMRELQNNPSLSEKDAIDLFTSRGANGDFIYTNWGGKGSIKPPKWLAPYKPPASAAYSAWEQAQADRQNRIADAMQKQGRAMRDYEGQTSDQKEFLASRGLGYRRKRYATGGGVGTDTVPALLTPGEFVINRASAQRIGYNNLHRMNKVGKYATGGVVQRFASGGTPTASSFQSNIRSAANTGAIEKDIADLSKSIKITKTRIDAYNPAIQHHTDTVDKLYKDSAKLDIQLSKYNTELIRLANQQGKATATGTAANRILDLKMKAETEAIRVEQLALQEEQKLTNIKKQQEQLIQQQNQQLAQKSQLAAQAKQQKQAATNAIGSTLQGGTQSSLVDVNAKGKAIVRQNRKDAARSASSFGGGGNPIKDIGGAAIAVSMVTASLQAMLPPLDENSSTLTQLSHSFLGLITTLSGVAFALQSFGVTLKAQSAIKFLSGGGLSADGIQSVFNAVKGMGGSTNLAGNIAGVANSFAKMLGPTIAIVGGLTILKMAVDNVSEYFNRFEEKKQAAIQKGDIETAGKVAGSQARNATSISGTFAGGAIGTIIGGIAGMFAGPGGAIIGAKIGASVGSLVGAITEDFFAGGLVEEASNTAMAFAANSKASKDLAKAQSDAALAAEKFKNGTISADEYLNTFSQSAKSISESKQYADKVTKQSTENRSTGFGALGRDIVTGLGGGLMGMEWSSTRNKRLSQEGIDVVKTQRENESKLFDSSTEARNAVIRSTIARGGSIEDAQKKVKEKTGFDAEDMRRRASTLGFQAERARQSGDAKLAGELDTQSQGLFAQANQLEDSFENLEKEVRRAKESYDAMNLGLRSASATASALSASMDHFSSGLEVGGSQFVNDVEFLQQAMSSSAQAMDPAEIKSAVKGVSDNLRQFGSSEEYIKKFEGNVAAFTQAQGNYNKAFDNIKKSMADKDFKNLSPDDLKKKFAEELTNGMGKDVSEEAKKNLKAVINGMELDSGDVDKIMAGDLSVFGDKLSEAQKKMLEDVQKIAQERAKAEQVLIDFTKKRIDAERNLVQAQQEALDLVMEGREIQGKYGGAAVTNEERKQNLLAKSNVESNRLGLTAMRTGDVGDLRRRNAELKGNFAAIEARRSQQGGMQGQAGVMADEESKDLQKAYKTQIETIRGLIKLEEEQLKITQEKNKLEKESMESLIKGDVEEFFKKQSAAGATAAIASGDQRLMNLYGGEALGTAYQDIQRQQDAGVQTLYGQQLAGPGGLTEAAANAALSSRGINDMRAAQVMAGTTPEEEASKARLRELGGVLGDTGQLGAEMAEMQVQTATINVNSAQLKFSEVMNRGNEKAKEAQNIENQKANGMSRGGPVYASRGIFVPRGTDTIPAMLTPGEFVVNRAAVQRDNNLSILQAMNNGSGSVSNDSGAVLMARGGMVRYRSAGSSNPESPASGGMFENMSKFVTAISNFNSDLSSNIDKLGNTKISIKLDSTSVSINLNDGGLLKALTSQVKQEIFNLVKTRLVAGEGGRLRENAGVI